MPLSLVERLNTVRRHRFIGRKLECDLFKSVLDREHPFSVLYIHGPSGIGKTSLLRELAQIGKSAQTPVISINGHKIEASPESFLNRLQLAMNLTPAPISVQTLADKLNHHILLIDSYDRLAALDDWLRDVFLPQLPEHTLIVLAGRRPPAFAWRADPGWQALLHPLPLGNLSQEESQLYLAQRQVSEAQRQAILNFSHGHPLALSLMADRYPQGKDASIQLEAPPDVVKILLENYLQEVSSPVHRMALEACALVRLMTEALLAEMLDIPDVHELFEWLRGLSFIESGQMGVFPHDLAREVFTADLRWRNPDRYAQLHQRARDYYSAHLEQTQGYEQHQILFDQMFLHRNNSAVGSGFMWQTQSYLTTDKLREGDRPALIEMTAKHEGEASARLAAYWLARQPHNVWVFRDREQSVTGFFMMVALHQASPKDLSIDPAAYAAWRHLQKHAPLRSQEAAILVRFWMARNTYQSVSPTQSLIVVNALQQHRNTPGIAFTLISCADPDSWSASFAYADFERIPNADFEVGERRYGVYGHDWRVVSPIVWQELLAKREIAPSTQAIAPFQPTKPPLVLSQPEFMQAVRDVFRHYTCPDTLYTNPLMRSRLVADQAAMGDSEKRVTVLQGWVREATESLQASPRDEKLYRALYRTYLNPAPTQERAAESLDLPFSTYRRHLKTGVTRVANILWQREIRYCS
ncbi:MAG: AAA family ATPase [Leptolyngbyaceae cyanobacterium MO_188.B28]|nr:AAA family ATPase [Leptolyngbyaceae cyanobacterium MO_188.B28]